jgi:hypothetical protein
MADLTQPATAAEFIAAGADPVAARQLASQHNLMSGREGSFDERVDFAHLIENQPPPPKAALTPQTSNAQLADASVQHQNHQLTGQMDATFAPPASPWDYKFPEPVEPPTNESLARDTAIKEAFHREGIPAWAITSVLSNLSQDARTLETETPAQVQVRLDSATDRLSRMWGAAYEGNVATVGKFLDELQKDPALRDDIRTARRAIVVNPLTMDTILQIATHRTKKP